MRNNFKNICKILFDQDCVEMELEDEVRFQLYVDHLKLHQVELSSSKNCHQASKSNRVELETISNHRYLKKLFKLFTQWRQVLDQTEATYADTCGL